jgi:hypothetical protein
MEIPQIRPGKTSTSPTEPQQRVVAYFYNSAPANMAIQILTALGIPNDQLGITPPERIESGQGMVLSIACKDEKMAAQVESLCRDQGANVHRQRRA